MWLAVELCYTYSINRNGGHMDCIWMYINSMKSDVASSVNILHGLGYCTYLFRQRKFSCVVLRLLLQASSKSNILYWKKSLLLCLHIVMPTVLCYCADNAMRAVHHIRIEWVTLNKKMQSNLSLPFSDWYDELMVKFSMELHTQFSHDQWRGMATKTS